ncbi:MAG TPA: ABC transporter ATP-binding protein [Steroidobacteraceae bacterium]|jgi:ABC-2 type transport system ATP-binding protein|nr:ABC transporter ATP-binding protein [Steroidobacteraceae bacterium]
MTIEIENLHKAFGRHEALCGLSLAVPEGSAYALIGANGAGKTTTIKTLMNIIRPTRGSTRILGVDSRRLGIPQLRHIGYVSENQDMPARLTVAQYLDYLRPFYPTWDRELERSMLKELRLPPERRIGDLSHGMRMKMALACALPFRPRVLILDEPFSGLDPLVRDEFMERLLHQAGEMTILISSHELAEIEGVTSHVGFIDQGRLLFQESMIELSDRFRLVRVTLDSPGALPTPAPEGWLQPTLAGNVVSFVDSRFSEQRLAEGVAARFKGVRNVEVQPLALRRIFTTLARESREGSAS